MTRPLKDSKPCATFFSLIHNESMMFISVWKIEFDTGSYIKSLSYSPLKDVIASGALYKKISKI